MISGRIILPGTKLIPVTYSSRAASARQVAEAALMRLGSALSGFAGALSGALFG